ncbi:MAG: peptidoglycan DD-metalloendopeptidase family protein [Pseudomonadota bacterium]
MPPPGARRRRLGPLAATLATALALSPPAIAQTDDPAAALAGAEAALRAAETALREAGRGDGQLAALGQAVRAHETVLAVHRDSLRRLAGRAGTVQGGIAVQRERIGALIAALQSLSTAPRSALFAFPGGPLDAARAETLLAAVTPALERRRIDLAAELDRLHRLRIEQDLARLGATETLAALQDLRARTAIALDERRADLPPRRLLQKQADRAGAAADSVGALAETLADLSPPAGNAAPAPRPFEERRGALALPAAGTVTGRFGDPDPWGAPGAGIVIEAPAWAEVTSPVAATIRYAGHLEGYGRVVILEPASDWLITLAGLASADRAIGEIVRPGERLGSLGRLPVAPTPASDQPEADAATNGAVPLPPPAEILLAQDGGNDLIEIRQLYVEIRREGVPLDPAPWFAATQ